MSFTDIKQRLTKYFLFITPPEDSGIKSRVRHRTMESFNRQKNQKNRATLNLWRYRFSFSFSLFLIVGALGFLENSVRETQLLAGEVSPTNGPIEIIRGSESFLVEDPVQIFVGDIIKTGNHGEATISIPNQFTSFAKNKTQLRITNQKALFLDKGKLEGKAMRGAEIATDRGFMKSAPGGNFEITVSETGETEIKPHKNSVQVFDLWDGNATLYAGEEIKLSSDTHLNNNVIPEGLALSNAQINVIKAKLSITRSKIITGVEESLVRNNKKARADFNSAEKTFLSLTQVLQTSRELEISRRKNLQTLDVKSIFAALAEKVEDPEILAEIKSVETLFVILSQNKGKMAFAPPKSEIESFNRYVTLKNLISLGTPEQQTLTQPLLHKYVVSFLRKIQNNELRIEQIAMLNEEVNKFPRTKVAREFLDSTKVLFAPEMGTILDEKIERYF